MKRLLIDFETRSRVDLKTCGVYVYAEDNSTDVICMAAKMNEDAPDLWISDSFRVLLNGKVRANGLPLMSTERMLQMIEDADEIHAHNAQFERVMWHYVMHLKYGYPDIPLHKWRCTAAKAAYFALPRSLGQAAEALGLPEQKDYTGYRTMLKLCKPNSAGFWNEDPADFLTLFHYCVQDVKTEKQIDDALPDLPAEELEMYRLDQKINDRGVYVDLESIDNLIYKVEEKERKLGLETQVVTKGIVKSVKQVGATIRWMRTRGVEVEDLTKESVKVVSGEDGIPADVKRILEIRASLAKSSVAKLGAMKRWANKDSRVRGSLLYYGANTGRWSGKGIQPQNYPRESFGDVEIQKVLRSGIPQVDREFGDTMHAVSKCLRGMLTAAPGRVLLCEDFASIEARVLAWLASEEDTVKAFREGKDLYKVEAGKIYRKKPEDVTKEERLIGKVCIAEGELVLTDQGLIPIEKITLAHRVWDGIEWVSHSGVIDNGIQEVITYEGLTATPTHEVYIEGQERPVHFRDARLWNKKLIAAGYDRTPIRYSGYCKPDNSPERVGLCVHSDPVYALREKEMGLQTQSFSGKVFRVPKLFAENKPFFENARQEICGNKMALREPPCENFCRLRRQGDKVYVQVEERVYFVGGEESTPSRLQSKGDRSDRQQRALFTGKSKAINAKRKLQQSQNNGFYNVQKNKDTRDRRLPRCSDRRSESFICPFNSSKSYSLWGANDRADNPKVLRKEKRQTKRVYDITNAGPRHRFTVSGKLVSNCTLALGYQGWLGAFESMARVYGLEIPEEKAKEIIIAWREAHPRICAFWKGVELAAITAVKNPGKAYAYGRIKFAIRGRFLHCKLPSGRLLAYCDPGTEIVKTKYGIEKEVISFKGMDNFSNKWIKMHTYGGKISENVSQSVARDLLRDALMRLEKNKFNVIAHVHDEIIAEENDTSRFELFHKLIGRVPAWAGECPIGSEGWHGTRYRKA